MGGKNGKCEPTATHFCHCQYCLTLNRKVLGLYLGCNRFESDAIVANSWLIQVSIGERPIVLDIDETGDVKKGEAKNYLTKQDIGNLG